MNPQFLFELARIEHENRVAAAQKAYRRRPVPRRRRRWHAPWRPPSRPAPADLDGPVDRSAGTRDRSGLPRAA